MTNSIVINDKSRTIEITKKFAAAAKNFGSQEYEMLQTARSHYPNFYVKVRSAARKADHFKGLTFDYMEKYIKKHNMELLKVTSKNISPKAKKYGIIEPTNKVGDLDAVESICRR